MMEPTALDYIKCQVNYTRGANPTPPSYTWLPENEG